MFSDELGYQEPDENGEYLIDRNPSQFQIILDFLRGYEIRERLGELNTAQRSILRNDVDYYNIKSMFLHLSDNK
jgi:hypothetical protein